MTVLTTTDQSECIEIIRDLGCLDSFKPIPPAKVCDGITELGKGCWLVMTNDSAKGYTVHLLQDASKEEAWKFYDSQSGNKARAINHRAIMNGNGNNN